MSQEEIKKIQYCIDLVIQNFGENEDLEKIYNKLDSLLIAQNERDTYKRLAESEAKEKNKYKDIVDDVKQYNDYLINHCSYRLNKGHLIKIRAKLRGAKQ